MLVDYVPQLLGDIVQRLCQSDLLKTAVCGSLKRMQQTLRPVMQLFGMKPLGAGVPPRHRLILVAADVYDPIAFVQRQQGAAAAAANPAE